MKSFSEINCVKKWCNIIKELVRNWFLTQHNKTESNTLTTVGNAFADQFTEKCIVQPYKHNSFSVQ